MKKVGRGYFSKGEGWVPGMVVVCTDSKVPFIAVGNCYTLVKNSSEHYLGLLCEYGEVVFGLQVDFELVELKDVGDFL